MTPARRILLLITDLRIGGTPTVVRELAIRLNASPNVVVEVACLAPNGPVGDELRSAGVHVEAMGAIGPADLRVLPRLVRLVRRGRYDTVVSFLVHANAMAAMARLFCPGVRFIQSIQTTQPKPHWHWWVQRFARHAAARIVVPSESVARVAGERSRVPPPKLQVIPNAIDGQHLSDGAAVPAVSAQQAPKSTTSILIGFIGRLDPVKRVPDLVRAVKLLGEHVHLHIFGDGPERARIESLIAELDLAGRVTLHGTVRGPHAALGQITVLVLPSETEGFGLVLIEAMAAGVPVVATDVPGIRDVVRAEHTGLLVPAGSPSDLAAAISRLLDDAGLRDRLIAAARQDVRRRFTWDVVLPAYRALLEIDGPSR